MNINLLPLIVLLGAMALAALLLIGYRKVVANGEDDMLHVSNAEIGVSRQTDIANRLESVDRWEKMLILLTAVYGTVLGAIYLYKGWIDANTASLGR